MPATAQATIKKAVEHNPITSIKGISERLFTFWFDGFVYNQIWEDPRVDMEAMQLDEESRILTIASGGCNILNYLTALPHSIHVVDLNKYHLFLTKLKFEALRSLPSYEDFFLFFGHANQAINVENYNRYIRDHLDEETRAYWDSSAGFRGPRIGYFSKNLYNYGAMGLFIRFVHRLSKWFACDPEKMLQCKNQGEREALFIAKFEPFFQKRIVKFLGSSPLTYYSLGIPPQQFEDMKEESEGRIHELCHNRVRRMALDFPLEDNYFAWQAFGRRYDTENRKAVPDYLKEEHYEKLKNNLKRVNLNYCSTTQYLKEQPDNSLNRFVFLDSQDWMNDDEITELWSEVARVGMPGSRVIFRTASWKSPIEGALPESLLNRYTYEEQRSKELYKQDRSAIYGGFHLYVLND